MDRYDEQELIGTGGMSTVSRVFDRVLLRDTAQKLIHPRFLHSGKHLERFQSEAQITGQLEHPNIVPVHDYGLTEEGRPFINMKLVEGDTLESLVQKLPGDRLEAEPLANFIRILLKVCDALAFAHSRGIIHRDTNPTNIMVGTFGEVYLMDWGVSTRLEGSPIRSEPGAPPNSASGTPAYMAPEQLRDSKPDPRTDVFALGATLYFILTGVPPYPGPTAIQALSQALECEWTPLEELLGDRVPAGLNILIHRCMQKNPDDRYPSIKALQTDLQAWLRGRWHLPTRSYSAGQVIVREGEEAREAYLIIRGSCEARHVVDGTHTTLSRMGPGDAFGEMAIFGHVNRTSTVVATSQLEVQVVNRTNLSSAAGLDSWVGQFVSAVTSRFIEAESRLQQLQDQLDRMKTQLEELDKASE